jgi:hypothetical protein
VNFKLKTAATSDGLDAATYYTFNNSNCTKDGTEVTCSEAQMAAVSATLTDGVNDQYFQYQIELTSTGANTPTFSDSTVTYVRNNPPDVQAVTAVQNSDGTVTVGYETRDTDTSTGATPYDVNISLQYCTADCSTPGSETWATAATLSGDYGAGIDVEEVNYNSYSLTWTAKTDYGGNYNGTDFKVRIRADDGEAANNYGYGESAVFTLDTKDPVPGADPVLVDASSSPGTITLDCADDTALQMKVGLAADLSDASWESYGASKNLALTDDPETVYAQFRDAKGNTTSILDSASADTPSAFMIQDTTNASASPADPRLFIAWQEASAIQANGNNFLNYKLYKSTNGTDYSLLNIQTDRAVNYYTDEDVILDADYWYKIKITDDVGNVSYFTSPKQAVPNGTQDQDEGGGGPAPGDFPVISNVSAGTPTSTSVTITWQTDDPSDSVVQYMTETGGDFEGNNALSKGKATFADSDANLGDHSVTLTGLTPGTAYYYQVISTTADGAATTDKFGTNGYSFTTASGPAISNVAVSSETNSGAIVTWTTTGTNSTSYLYYSTDAGLANPTKIGTEQLTTNHSTTLSGLNADTTYYFKVESTDTNSATTTDDNGGSYYTFTTNDSTGPVISNHSQPIVTHNSAALYWLTDEAAATQARYRQQGSSTWTDTTLVSYYERSHYVTLTSLESGTDYEYQAISADIAGNSTTSATQTFTTLKDPEYQHDPLSEISDVETSVVTDSKAVITFTTDQPAKCAVEYGTTKSNLNEIPVSEDNYNYEHSIHLAGLISETTYYYQLTCEDNLENVVADNNSGDKYSFTTLEETDAEADTTAPAISNVKTSSITGESVTVSWKTDEKANSMVSYGITSGTYESGAINYTVNSTTDNYTTDHEVIINGLVPDTKYYYVVMSTDTSGNIGESDEKSFTTSSISSLGSIKITSTKLGEATVTWETSKKMSSIVEYGETSAYGNLKESSTLTESHEITISDLKQNTEYHLRVKGKDEDNNLYSSGDYTFTPKSPPQVTNIQTKDATEHEITITFATSAPTDSLITYFNTTDPEDQGSQGNPQLSTTHSLTLRNLHPGTAYNYTIRVTDIDGNTTTHPAEGSLSFTTGEDLNPPVIDQVRTDSALAQQDKVQTIISWLTDEPADTTLLYREGINAPEKEVKVSDALVTQHIAVITIFQPGSVYYFRARSTDVSGNTATSGDFALLTPKRKENIIQIIISNFQEIFGWVPR